jgi:pimeloyl-ACP methyl ester carboxylesterase
MGGMIAQELALLLSERKNKSNNSNDSIKLKSLTLASTSPAAPLPPLRAIPKLLSKFLKITLGLSHMKDNLPFFLYSPTWLSAPAPQWTGKHFKKNIEWIKVFHEQRLKSRPEQDMYGAFLQLLGVLRHRMCHKRWKGFIHRLQMQQQKFLKQQQQRSEKDQASSTINAPTSTPPAATVTSSMTTFTAATTTTTTATTTTTTTSSTSNLTPISPPPPLVIHGSLDTLISLQSAKYLAKNVGGEMVVFEGTGHALNHEDCDRFNGLVLGQVLKGVVADPV